MKMSKAVKRKHFSTWATQWLALAKPTVKGNTFAASYKNPVENHLIPYFGGKCLTTIKQADIQHYISIAAGKYSLDTVKKHKSCLYQIFDTAIENGYCLKNPVRSIKIRDVKERTEKYVYTIEQEQLVFDYAYNHRFGTEIQFMLVSGVSRGELLAIRWENVHLNRRYVSIKHGAALVPNAETGKQETVIGDTKNKYRRRDIPLEDEICRILRGLPRKSSFVFCTKDGGNHNPRTWARRHFDVFMQDMHNFYEEQGIDVPLVNSHQLRHTRLSQMVNSGKNPIAVAKFAGHANMNMLLERYVHSTTDELRVQLGMK
jgi:integrase